MSSRPCLRPSRTPVRNASSPPVLSLSAPPAALAGGTGTPWTWAGLEARRPLPLRFVLMPSRRVSKALCPCLVVVVAGVEVFRILDPEHREPFVSLSRIFQAAERTPVASSPSISSQGPPDCGDGAIRTESGSVPAPMTTVEGLLRFGLRRERGEFDLTLAGLEPFEDIWAPLAIARQVAADLRLLEPLGALLDWKTRYAWSLDEGRDAGLVHNWRIPSSILDPSLYSTAALLSTSFSRIEILPEGQQVRTQVDRRLRYAGMGSVAGFSSIYQGGPSGDAVEDIKGGAGRNDDGAHLPNHEDRRSAAHLAKRRLEEELVRWTVQAYEAWLDVREGVNSVAATTPTTSQGGTISPSSSRGGRPFVSQQPHLPTPDTISMSASGSPAHLPPPRLSSLALFPSASPRSSVSIDALSPASLHQSFLSSLFVVLRDTLLSSLLLPPECVSPDGLTLCLCGGALVVEREELVSLLDGASVVAAREGKEKRDDAKREREARCWLAVVDLISRLAVCSSSYSSPFPDSVPITSSPPGSGSPIDPYHNRVPASPPSPASPMLIPPAENSRLRLLISKLDGLEGRMEGVETGMTRLESALGRVVASLEATRNAMVEREVKGVGARKGAEKGATKDGGEERVGKLKNNGKRRGTGDQGYAGHAGREEGAMVEERGINVAEGATPHGSLSTEGPGHGSEHAGASEQQQQQQRPKLEADPCSLDTGSFPSYRLPEAAQRSGTLSVNLQDGQSGGGGHGRRGHSKGDGHGKRLATASTAAAMPGSLSTESGAGPFLAFPTFVLLCLIVYGSCRWLWFGL